MTTGGISLPTNLVVMASYQRYNGPYKQYNGGYKQYSGENKQYGADGGGDKKNDQTSKQAFENKTSLIMQSFYLLNKSGTKRVTLGLEPALDFEPILQLHKPGFEGLRISSATWHELMKASPYISSYFNGEMRAERMREELLLSNLEKVQFRQQYGRHLISISSVLDDKKEVVLAEATWKHLRQYRAGNLLFIIWFH